MNKLLTAVNFAYCSTVFNQDFEDIMAYTISCYGLMKSNGCLLPNDENLIRDKIVNNYLQNNKVRKDLGIDDYFFVREWPTINNSGRVDIYIVMRDKSFQDTNACYVIECKRLDTNNQHGTTGLNAEYIKNGISRFTSQKYTTYDNTAGMIGFIVEEMDTHQNVLAINTLLEQHFSNINTEEFLTPKTIVSDFEYSYFSRHRVDGVSKIIYHLMFDFSDNITP